MAGDAAANNSFTGEWYRVRFDGISHTVNLLSAEVLAAKKGVTAAHNRADAAEKEMLSMRAEFGKVVDELAARLDEATKRLDAATRKQDTLIERLKSKFDDTKKPKVEQ